MKYDIVATFSKDSFSADVNVYMRRHQASPFVHARCRFFNTVTFHVDSMGENDNVMIEKGSRKSLFGCKARLWA